MRNSLVDRDQADLDVMIMTVSKANDRTQTSGTIHTPPLRHPVKESVVRFIDYPFPGTAIGQKQPAVHQVNDGKVSRQQDGMSCLTTDKVNSNKRAKREEGRPVGISR